MADYVLSIIDRLGVPDVEIWGRSLKRTGFRGRVVLFAYSPDLYLSKWCEMQGIELARLKAHPEPPRGCNKERWLLYADLLDRTCQPGDRVIATDARDVYFQLDPSIWLDAHMSDQLVLSSEGICYHEEKWNRQHAIEVGGREIYDLSLKNRSVINAGIVAGPATKLSEFCRQIYTLAYNKPENPSDQIILNLVAAKRDFSSLELDAGWACHGRVLRLLRDPKPTVIDDAICCPNGSPYVIVHQYQSVKEWQKIIDKKITS